MTPHPSSVEDLNLALRLYRRLMLRVALIVILGFAAVFALGALGTALSPPYGLYILGWDLSTWGLVILVALLIAEFWWEGRAIGRALNDPILLGSPVVGVISALGVIAERATAMGMEWSGFLGPLRPAGRTGRRG